MQYIIIKIEVHALEDDIGIEGNPIKEKAVRTFQYSYDYKGDSKALSEYDGLNNLKALEYEVFQVIFY